MQSLLSRITRADIRRDPFPHVVASDVLDTETCRLLGESFPPFARIGWDNPRVPPRSNRRFELSGWLIETLDDMPDIWRRFVARHASPDFFAEVVALFRDDWPAALVDTLGGDLMGHRMGRLMRDSFDGGAILQDARVEINTPVIGAASSSRGPHLDMPNRLFSCLYYLRHPDDDAEGGDLELFRWKHAPVASITCDALPPEAVERVATIPYRANQLVIFPNGINAIHGVSVRQPTPHTRRYVFVTAEIAANWLVSPVAHGGMA
ncbi:MAG: 2OG-Fe(II) oxygenase [Pseudomonadota bacterium]